VRGVFGSLLFGGIGIAAIGAGGIAGLGLGIALIAAALAGLIWIAGGDSGPLRVAGSRWWWSRYRRCFNVRETRCSNCGRTLVVVPVELAMFETRRSARLIARAPQDAVRAERNGFFDCSCGAVGWVREHYVRPPADRAARPTTVQRQILESLAMHPEGITDMEFERLERDTLATLGELAFAKERGWVTAKLAGFGGTWRVPVIYELTDQGRAALRQWAPHGPGVREWQPMVALTRLAYSRCLAPTDRAPKPGSPGSG
jgi:hypothetical protein